MREKIEQEKSQFVPHSAEVQAEQGWTMAGLRTVIARRWVWLAASCIACLLLATLYWLVKTPQYTASGLLQLETAPSSSFGLADSVNGMETRSTEDALDVNMTLTTDVNLLTSNTLALKVIEQLGLERTPAFEHAERGIGSGSLEPLSVPLAQAPKRRYVALKLFAHELRVKALDGTRLIEVRYRDPNPQLAAEVVNTLMQNFLSYGAALRSAQTAQTAQWLHQQLTDLKSQTANLEAQALAAEHKAGHFGLNGQSNLALAQLEALNQQLAQDRANVALKAAIDHTVESNNPALISELAGNAANSPGVQNTLSLLQTLEARSAAVRAQIAADTTRYGSRFPQMIALHDQLRSLEQSTGSEIARLGARAHNDYLVALRNEQQARQQLAQEQAQMSGQNTDAVAAVLAREQADASQALYQSLLARFRAAGILDALHLTDLSLASPALVPAENHPSSPRFLLDEAVGLLLGLLLGCLLMAATEACDTRINGRIETESLLGAALLATLPSATQSPTLQEAQGSEPYRLLRAALLAEAGSHATQVVVVTNPAARSGPLNEAQGLARAFARKPKRTLLLRAESESSHEPESGQGGLLALLAWLDRELNGDLSHADDRNRTENPEHAESFSRALEAQIQADPEHPNLRVLPYGQKPREADELFEAETLGLLIAHLRKSYDHVVIEAPGYLLAPEPTALCQLADVVLLVLHSRLTERNDALDALARLERQIPDQTALGVVLAGVSADKTCSAMGLAKGRTYARAN